ncbi:HDIG domain-containing protein [bacterium]|nr:HDIG domain-containing protein [bacterium]
MFQDRVNLDSASPDSNDNRHESIENADRDQPERSRKFVISRKHLSYLLLTITAFLLLPFFIPFKGVESDIPDVGDISSKEVIAPFNFPIVKPETEFEREKQTARQNVPYVLNYVDGVVTSAKSEFSKSWTNTLKAITARGTTDSGKIDSIKARFPEISEESARTLAELRKPAGVKTSVLELLSESYSEGIFNWKSLGRGDTAQLFNIRRNGQEQVIPAERITTIEVTIRKIGEKSASDFSSYPDKGHLVYELTTLFLRPNLLPDKELTEQKRQKAVDGVKRERGIVLRDQRIVDEHERVSDEIHQKLVSLAIAKSSKYSNRPTVYNALTVLARLLLALLILWIFSKYIQIRFPQIWNTSSSFSILLFSIWFPCLFAFIFRAVGWPDFITPIAFSAALLAVLIGLEPAIAVIFTASILTSIASKNPHNLLITLLVEGTICSILFSRIQVRRESIKAIAWTSASALIAIAVLDFVSLTEYGTLGIRALSVLSACVFGPLLALGLLPLFEKFSGLVTDFTLADYANTNAQILQQLAIEAPGTFHHCIVVSNMAETAAESIGADPLLAKAGALYHDIGKLSHPYYFSENLTEDNPHERLSPKMSFIVLSGHVTEGVRIARKNDIPRPIIDIIQQHHGDSVMRFFYEKAREVDDSVTENDFSYPGPKPQSKEAAIVMLADTVEATVRSIKDIEKKSLLRLINNSIENKFSTGQLADCDLTTGDLKLITDSFIRILEGVLHRRPRLRLKNGGLEGQQTRKEDH